MNYQLGCQEVLGGVVFKTKADWDAEHLTLFRLWKSMIFDFGDFANVSTTFRIFFRDNLPSPVCSCKLPRLSRVWHMIYF